MGYRSARCHAAHGALTGLLWYEASERRTRWEEEEVFGRAPVVPGVWAAWQHPPLSTVASTVDGPMREAWDRARTDRRAVDEWAWWCLNVMPWQRGTASLVEILSTALATRVDGRTYQWTGRCDFEAFTTPLAEFALDAHLHPAAE